MIRVSDNTSTNLLIKRLGGLEVINKRFKDLGLKETKLNKDLREDKEQFEKIIDRTPMKRWGNPKDISGAAIYLASDKASFTTGATIVVDGGYSIA